MGQLGKITYGDDGHVRAADWVPDPGTSNEVSFASAADKTRGAFQLVSAYDNPENPDIPAMTVDEILRQDVQGYQERISRTDIEEDPPNWLSPEAAREQANALVGDDAVAKRRQVALDAGMPIEMPLPGDRNFGEVVGRAVLKEQIENAPTDLSGQERLTHALGNAEAIMQDVTSGVQAEQMVSDLNSEDQDDQARGLVTYFERAGIDVMSDLASVIAQHADALMAEGYPKVQALEIASSALLAPEPEYEQDF